MPWSWPRFWLHFPIGLLIGISNIPIALGLITLFALYEITEDWHIKDKAYIDVQGALGGVMAVAVLRWALAIADIDLVQIP